MSRPSYNPQARYITLSWDDGHPCDMRLAELLKKYELKATFYVPRRSQRGTINEHEIRLLASEFEVGAHTLNHVVLTRVSTDVAREEIIGSRKWIEDVTGKACVVFCFPEGKFYTNHVELCCEAGFKGARTVELLSLRTLEAVGAFLLIPTTVQVYPHTKLTYLRNIAKRMKYDNFINFIRSIHVKSWKDLCYYMIHRLVTSASGGVMHIWGHSWEVHELDLWADLEDVFKFIQDVKKLVKVCTNSDLCLLAKDS